MPIGIVAFKTVLLSDLPIKLGLEFKGSVVRPDAFGTDWQLEFTVIPVTPNFVANWLK